jgi:hypothetical protein
LRKGEILADLFNNQDAEDAQQPVRVRLSHLSRALMEELHRDLKQLFAENDGLEAALNQVEVQDEEWVDARRVDLSLRKLGAYLRWLDMGQLSEGGVPEAYTTVHRLGKDEELRTIVDRNLQRRQEAIQERGRHAPNYYYSVYPETYAFN